MLSQYLKLLFVTSLLYSLLPEKSYGAIENQNSIMDGQHRSWRLFVPESYSNEKPLPLVFNFHGTSTNAEFAAKLTEMETLAEKYQFIVVAPNAEFSYKSDGPKTWNVEDIDSPYNDVHFVKQLIEKISSEYAVDEKRIYATGYSGGARMSSKLACEMTDSFAAIAPVAGVRFAQNCKPSGAIPVITYHGIKDPVNHYVLQDDSPVYWHEGIEPAVDKWVANNQCKSHNESALSPGVTKIIWSECDKNADIIFIKSENGGHTWPGSPLAEMLAKFRLGSTDDFNMSETIWHFFESHSKGGASN